MSTRKRPVRHYPPPEGGWKYPHTLWVLPKDDQGHYWPARVVEDSTREQMLSNRKADVPEDSVCVTIFGRDSIEWVKQVDIEPFLPPLKTMRRQLRNRTFLKALEEAKDWHQKAEQALHDHSFPETSSERSKEVNGTQHERQGDGKEDSKQKKKEKRKGSENGRDRTKERRRSTDGEKPDKERKNKKEEKGEKKRKRRSESDNNSIEQRSKQKRTKTQKEGFTLDSPLIIAGKRARKRTSYYGDVVTLELPKSSAEAALFERPTDINHENALIEKEEKEREEEKVEQPEQDKEKENQEKENEEQEGKQITDVIEEDKKENEQQQEDQETENKEEEETVSEASSLALQRVASPTHQIDEGKEAEQEEKEETVAEVEGKEADKEEGKDEGTHETAMDVQTHYNSEPPSQLVPYQALVESVERLREEVGELRKDNARKEQLLTTAQEHFQDILLEVADKNNTYLDKMKEINATLLTNQRSLWQETLHLALKQQKQQFDELFQRHKEYVEHLNSTHLANLEALLPSSLSNATLTNERLADK
ncbi:TFIIS central domain-containing protein [Balamuthia mandrillaris]